MENIQLLTWEEKARLRGQEMERGELEVRRKERLIRKHLPIMGDVIISMLRTYSGGHLAARYASSPAQSCTITLDAMSVLGDPHVVSSHWNGGWGRSSLSCHGIFWLVTGTAFLSLFLDACTGLSSRAGEGGVLQHKPPSDRFGFWGCVIFLQQE